MGASERELLRRRLALVPRTQIDRVPRLCWIGPRHRAAGAERRVAGLAGAARPVAQLVPDVPPADGARLVPREPAAEDGDAAGDPEGAALHQATLPGSPSMPCRIAFARALLVVAGVIGSGRAGSHAQGEPPVRA